MFNGIVEAVSTIKELNSQSGSINFTIEKPATFDDLFIGASVAINGVCLTITHFTDTFFKVTAVPETLRLSNLSQLNIDNNVNLERAMLANSRMGGHYIQGHVDAKGSIKDMKPEGNALLVTIQIPRKIARYLVKKGYVGIDGMSITVIDVFDDAFTVTFIPQTQDATIIKHYKIGTCVNIEVDILGKYVEKLLGAHIPCNPI